jgi:hypothetical protein
MRMLCITSVPRFANPKSRENTDSLNREPKTGAYPVWFYEHIYYRGVADQLATQIHDVAAASTVSGLLVGSGHRRGRLL